MMCVLPLTVRTGSAAPVYSQLHRHVLQSLPALPVLRVVLPQPASLAVVYLFTCSFQVRGWIFKNTPKTTNSCFFKSFKS